MPIAAIGLGLGTAIAGGGAAAASIYGAHKQAGAERDAAAIQKQSTDEALSDARQQRTYQQGQYANYLTRLEPFRNAGTAATGRLNSYASRALPASVPTNGNGPMVQIQAPDGRVQAVPAQFADHYVSRGGKVVQ